MLNWGQKFETGERSDMPFLISPLLWLTSVQRDRKKESGPEVPAVKSKKYTVRSSLIRREYKYIFLKRYSIN